MVFDKRENWKLTRRIIISKFKNEVVDPAIKVNSCWYCHNGKIQFSLNK